jgi:hypothetical protein
MSKTLSLVHRTLVWFALWFAPVAIIDMLLVRSVGADHLGRLLDALNTVTFLWVLTLAYFPVALVFSHRFREKFLPQLAGFAERDEREEAITATAARHTFLITLALQLVFLVMSFATVGLVRTPDGHGTLSVGFGLSSQAFNFVQHRAPGPDNAAKSPPPVDTTVDQWWINLMPPGGAPALLVLLLVQLCAFRVISRRQYAGVDP